MGGGLGLLFFGLVGLGLFGLARLGLLAAAEALWARFRPRWARRRPRPGRTRALGALEAAEAAHLLRLGFAAGGHSVHGALRYLADLETAPAPLREACGRALSRLRAGLGPVEALAGPGEALGPEGARLFRTLAGLWEAGPEAVDAALSLYAEQVRRRAVLAGELKGVLLPLRVIRAVLLAALLVAIALPVHPFFREGWLQAGPLAVLYPLLSLGGILAHFFIGRFVDAETEGLL